MEKQAAAAAAAAAAAGSNKKKNEMNVDPIMAITEKAQKVLLKAQRKAEFEARFNREQNKPDAGKTKGQLKAERRAIQEAQRAAKSGNLAVVKSDKTAVTKSKQPMVAQKPKPKNKLVSGSKDPAPEAAVKSELKRQPVAVAQPTLQTQVSIISNKEIADKILSHLPRRISDLNNLPVADLPPAVVRCGYMLHQKLIDPSSRCIAMLTAFRQIISEYQPVIDLKRELQVILFEKSMDFLRKCCPTSISMMNACKYLKSVFSRIETETDGDQLRHKVCKAIDQFVEEECICSRRAIAECARKKIFSIENQTILTFGYSTLIQQVFQEAIDEEKQFKVVMVDTRPRFEGRKMLDFLTKHEIPVTYILINAIPYVMNEVNKVMFEAHSVFCNGYVMSVMGAAQIAMVAQAYNVPVMVCCETYKYSDRAYTDSFMYNEMGGNTESFFQDNSHHMELVQHDPKISARLTCLDLLYDLVPREFVSAIITEKGLLPCNSVPAILRFRESK